MNRDRKQTAGCQQVRGGENEDGEEELNGFPFG